MKQLFAAEGMGGRLKRRGGQLVPLKDRLNAYQMGKRHIRIQHRRTVAQFLILQNQQMALVLRNYFGRGFFGRMKFLLAGR